MSKALAWVRKSKGSEDDIGLQTQREEVPALATQLAEEVEILDLGVQTGFSSLSRDDDGLLDHHEDVQDAVERIRDGEFDFLVAHDDRRICRDDYLSVIEYACVQGDCEIVFVSDDVETDDLAYDIHRRVERKTKEEEIEKAKAAIEERMDRGYDHGRPPIGFRYDDEGKFWVPDREGRFEDVLEALRLVEEEGASYSDVEEQIGIAPSTMSNIMSRREEYLEHAE